MGRNRNLWACAIVLAGALIVSCQSEEAARSSDTLDDDLSLCSRYFMNNLGGLELVNTYVTMGGMNHGLSSPCWAPEFLNVCVWLELCRSGDFIEELNEGEETPGDIHWVSIYGTEDSTVPNSSSRLNGAENIQI